MVRDANDLATAHVNVDFIRKATCEKLARGHRRRNVRVCGDRYSNAIQASILRQLLQIYQITCRELVLLYFRN